MLALIWFGFNGSDTASWIVGVPSVLIAAWAATRYPGRRSLRFRLTGFVGYSVYFLRQSLLGGWDVARRVLTRDMPIEPGHVSYTTALPAGPARDLLLSTISLLPGTLSAGLDGDRIDVHALDATSDVEADLGRLERRVAGVFSTPEGGR
ncbi:MAG: Na+/H+ antiporter subunit E [Thermoanaerobaculales bacterium]|jgi:multicomponent Na+:H+ antiporter subunit E|nr:Na+/H+ antiporter subunit E [Thermoanaerobaculales bacterium]